MWTNRKVMRGLLPGLGPKLPPAGVELLRQGRSEVGVRLAPRHMAIWPGTEIGSIRPRPGLHPGLVAVGSAAPGEKNITQAP